MNRYRVIDILGIIVYTITGDIERILFLTPKSAIRPLRNVELRSKMRRLCLKA